MSADIQKTTVDRFIEVDARLKGSLDEARRSQDERLAKVDVALHEATLASQRSAEDLKVSVVSAAKEQVEAHAKAAADLGEGVHKALGDLTRVLTSSQNESRRNQDDRLGKVEGALTRLTETHHQAVDDLKTSLLTVAKEQIQTQAGASSALRDALTQSLGDLGTRLAGSQVEARREQAQTLFEHKTVLDDARASQAKSMSDMQTSVTSALAELRDAQVKAFDGLLERVQSRLDELRKDNEAKLEKIRSTVEEKLQSTLETRLGASFRQVSEQLEQVYKGLGEMRTLATGVGDLRRVLTNVRSRGTFGEVQLGAILEQVFSPAQYASNVATVPGSTERVEFAVKLPGREEGGGIVFLPIDAKFPLEGYQRLQKAVSFRQACLTCDLNTTALIA
jgi:DNA recombination protein RmuC